MFVSYLFFMIMISLRLFCRDAIADKVQRTSTHCILVDSPTIICWKGPLVILGVPGLFCRFYPIFDGKF